MENKLYFGQPNDTGKFHIFNEKKISLCNKWEMPFTTFDEKDLVKGTEVCGKSDCKICFRKLKELISKLEDDEVKE
jgi:hypothetical protein